jgi:hypothetical protein
MGLGTACKEEASRMKKVLSVSSGERKLCLWVEKNCVRTEKNHILYIYIYINKCTAFRIGYSEKERIHLDD